ncbi:MAG TPA: EamA family transporter [Vicinamibacterales bacterium]|nr:EamA family transporter [Vicinamibacterales bacterium]
MSAIATAQSATVTRRAWIAWIAVCLIWGTTYMAIKVALETIPPFLMGGLRYIAAGVGLAGILALRGRSLPAVASWPALAVLGFFMIGFGNSGVVIGAQWLPSGLTAVLIATSPFWMVSVEAAVSGGQQLHARQWIGLSVGFLGILVLVWPDLMAGGEARRGMVWGVVAVQLACAGWSVGSAYTRRHVMPSDVLGAAAMQMVFGGIFMLVAGTLHGEWARLAFNTKTSVAFTYLTLAGSIVAFAAYSYALRHMDVAIVSLYTYINPVIAVVLGAIVLGEPLGWRMFVAAGLIAVGVLVVGPASKKENT